MCVLENKREWCLSDGSRGKLWENWGVSLIGSNRPAKNAKRRGYINIGKYYGGGGTMFACSDKSLPKKLYKRDYIHIIAQVCDSFIS